MRRLAICVLVSYLGLCLQASGQGGIITTVAGNGTSGFSGDGGPATAASLGAVGVAVDSLGSLFIADGSSRIRKVSAAGIINTVVGNMQGFSGDGGPATSAQLFDPGGVVVDVSGNLFIADSSNNRIRKVSANGIITTVAGSGAVGLFGGGFSGDGGPATSAKLFGPQGVAVDASGSLFIADTVNSVIRKVSPDGVISTVAGNGTQGFSGDGGPATSASFNEPIGVAVDASGNLFVADTFNNRIRKVSTSGIVTTVAGSGTLRCGTSLCGGFFGDGGLAISALLNEPWGVTLDVSGNLFIADTGNARIREVSASGVISTVAGDGSLLENGGFSFSGDGGPATSAALSTPDSVAVDASGNAFIADRANYRIRKVSAQAPSLTASPATLSFSLVTGEASSQQISVAGTPPAVLPWSASTTAGWITLNPTGGTTPATITIAVSAASLQPGSHTAGITISNPQASPARETVSVSLTVTAAGLSVYPAEVTFQSPQGGASESQTLQIGGTPGTAWNATAATSSGGDWLSVSPGGGQIPALLTALIKSAGLVPGTYHGSIAVQAPGAAPASIAISVVVTISPPSGQGGIINTVAGGGRASGTPNFSGDGGPATSAELYSPAGVTVDPSGSLFISDSSNQRIRKVSPSGIITTVAGNGVSGFAGDGGPATSALLNYSAGIAIDSSGNLLIADRGNNRIRKVSAASGIITTVAGNGVSGFSGDSGPAAAAELNSPWGLAVDVFDNLFIADWGNNRIRKVSASGIITTVAGNGANDPYGADIGDGGQATSAVVTNPSGIAVDASGEVFIAGAISDRIRKVSSGGVITTVAGSGTQFFSGDGGPASSADLYLFFSSAVAVDAYGNLFIADNGNNRIRKVSAVSGVITTVAGNGTQGFSGDGGPATSASLNNPDAVAMDAAGNLYVVDQGNSRIREVTAMVVVAPSISGVSPSSGAAGGPAFTLTVNGSGFVSGSVVEWNGAAVATSFVGANQLRASISASLVALPSSVSITVVNTGAGVSNAAAFTVNPAPPVISGLSPNSATIGGAAFKLTVNGSGFVSGSNVEWNGSPVATNYISASQLSATIPASLIGSQGGASVTVLNNAAIASNAVTFVVFSAGPNVQTISHIADGGGWRSSAILVNTDTAPALYAMRFWSDAGAPYALPLALGTATGSIPVGGSTIIETADTASALTTGWAELTSNQSLGGTAIFRYDPWSQEAAVPLLTSGSAKMEIPYQAGSGLSLGVALANPSTTQSASLTEVIRGQNRNQLASRTLTLPALNHTSFNPTFPSTVAGGGVVEYDSNVNIFGLGIRSAPEGAGLAFTSLDAVLPLAASTKTISHIADGGGWRSSIILVNTDTVPASYAVSFWNDAGASYVPPLALGTATGSIPVGGSTIIETADTASALTTGWAQVTSSQSVGGAAIFRYDPWSQEAAVPLLTSGGVKVEVPYQVGSGLSLGVALANPNATRTANITEVIRDQNGNQLASRTLTLAPLNHTSFNPTFPSGIKGSGAVEYDSNVNIFALGIRSAPEGTGLSFTSVPAGYK